MLLCGFSWNFQSQLCLCAKATVFGAAQVRTLFHAGSVAYRHHPEGDFGLAGSRGVSCPLIRLYVQVAGAKSGPRIGKGVNLSLKASARALAFCSDFA